MAYSDLLKDPRWQRKRLEVLQRDDFTCRWCGSKTETLHIHHGYYAKGRRPWEYNNESLWTVCEGCHDLTQDLRTDLRRIIGHMTPIEVDELTHDLIGKFSDRVRAETGVR